MIVGVICRLDSTVGKLDLLFQCRTQTHSERSRHLRLQRIGIDHRTTVDDTNDSVNLNDSRAFVHRDLRHFTDIASVGEKGGDSPSLTSSQWLSPTRLLRCQFNHPIASRVMLEMT